VVVLEGLQGFFSRDSKLSTFHHFDLGAHIITKMNLTSKNIFIRPFLCCLFWDY